MPEHEQRTGVINRLFRCGTLLCAIFFLFNGCASVPPWATGHLDSLDDFYDQGVGEGSTRSRADRNAQIALVGYRTGIQIGNVIEDSVRSYTKNNNELIVEVFTSKGIQKIEGTLPPGTQIAERWQDPSGNWRSYAVFEKADAKRRIQTQRDHRLRYARLRSVVPGWAQFTKGENLKGMRILATEGAALLGLATFTILQADFEDRRDRVQGIGTQARDDYQHYDSWANRFYWGSVACGALAGATYIYSLVDGLTHIPPTYKLLLSKARLRAGPSGPVLTFKYELD